ncbi:hypothetical protein TBLA_0A08390 [Henningerozyma blattae CBS 6284]|uniref:C2H2-type domain-containing protein n=1 Tax=Henningerozyma blattae (strain ATCC 34711 / CBS 6284 / DSM 70876 / NBRC 10599 / NRRL Y-10934 / UCD 77-7) TaxID=1071380 RepID=I2GWX6_HENB6|nr:hypothetical protein TBLA_0A08390 [Tetrapisispora blattae CBS 6284]CCH58628.1 hypothetical protein TBLA_0A08390 [Tetrapisispora blattae CBS 6284]
MIGQENTKDNNSKVSNFSTLANYLNTGNGVSKTKPILEFKNFQDAIKQFDFNNIEEEALDWDLPVLSPVANQPDQLVIDLTQEGIEEGTKVNNGNVRIEPLDNLPELKFDNNDEIDLFQYTYSKEQNDKVQAHLCRNSILKTPTQQISMENNDCNSLTKQQLNSVEIRRENTFEENFGNNIINSGPYIENVYNNSSNLIQSLNSAPQRPSSEILKQRISRRRSPKKTFNNYKYNIQDEGDCMIIAPKPIYLETQRKFNKNISIEPISQTPIMNLREEKNHNSREIEHKPIYNQDAFNSVCFTPSNANQSKISPPTGSGRSDMNLISEENIGLGIDFNSNMNLDLDLNIDLDMNVNMNNDFSNILNVDGIALDHFENKNKLPSPILSNFKNNEIPTPNSATNPYQNQIQMKIPSQNRGHGRSIHNILGNNYYNKSLNRNHGLHSIKEPNINTNESIPILNSNIHFGLLTPETCEFQNPAFGKISRNSNESMPFNLDNLANGPILGVNNESYSDIKQQSLNVNYENLKNNISRIHGINNGDILANIHTPIQLENSKELPTPNTENIKKDSNISHFKRETSIISEISNEDTRTIIEDISPNKTKRSKYSSTNNLKLKPSIEKKRPKKKTKEQRLGKSTSIEIDRTTTSHVNKIIQNAALMKSLATKQKRGYYRCTHCTETFSSIFDFGQHMDDNKFTRPYKCPIDSCPWKILGLPGRSDLRRHCGIQHSYDEIPESIRKELNLKEKEYPVLVCNHKYCQKVFHRSDAFNRHTGMVHLNESSRFNKRLNLLIEECRSKKDMSPDEQDEYIRKKMNKKNTHID